MVPSKSTRVAEILAQGEGGGDAHFVAYFSCFDAGLFYEAHDVLEHLWLKTRGGDYFFYKGLIQAAGAFVHLQKSRLRPALRLFDLAGWNLRPFRPAYRGVDVEGFLLLCASYRERIRASGYVENPLETLAAPRISGLVRLDARNDVTIR